VAQSVDKLTQEELAHKPILSRGQLQEIEEDPSKVEVVARLMGAVNLDNLFRHMQNPSVNPMARIEFQKLLNKMGRLEPEVKNDASGGGPQVIINITRAKDSSEGITIEGRALPDDA
jgi:hypothetical protein